MRVQGGGGDRGGDRLQVEPGLENDLLRRHGPNRRNRHFASRRPARRLQGPEAGLPHRERQAVHAPPQPEAVEEFAASEGHARDGLRQGRQRRPRLRLHPRRPRLIRLIQPIR